MQPNVGCIENANLEFSVTSENILIYAENKIIKNADIFFILKIIRKVYHIFLKVSSYLVFVIFFRNRNI